MTFVQVGTQWTTEGRTTDDPTTEGKAYWVALGQRLSTNKERVSPTGNTISST